MITEIIVLAMIAAFLGLRLYSVLGRRAEHEEESVPQRFDAGENAGENRPSNPANAQPTMQAGAPALRSVQLEGVMPAVERGIRDIASADNRFDLSAFMEGAKGAYGMVLEAFWTGDRDTLRDLCDDDVYQGFEAAIEAREEAGETLENSLIRVEETRIHSASLDGRMARISVLFVADIAAVTRDKDGNVIAGSLDDAIESRDVWTFSRNVGAKDPNWVLDETDEGLIGAGAQTMRKGFHRSMLKLRMPYALVALGMLTACAIIPKSNPPAPAITTPPPATSAASAALAGVARGPSVGALNVSAGDCQLSAGQFRRILPPIASPHRCKRIELWRRLASGLRCCHHLASDRCT